MLTIRRYGPMFILLLNFWSFTISFTLGLGVLSLTAVACLWIYNYAVKEWKAYEQDDLFDLNLLNLNEKE